MDNGYVVSTLLLYNLIFIAPFLAITVAVSAGFAKIEDVSGWKDTHMKFLHGIAGSIMLLIGLGMIAGFF
jgi:cytochrome c biogenesis protein CcdA